MIAHRNRGRASALPPQQPVPLDLLLAAVPSLPRAILARLTARMIERLDEMDGDPDYEHEEDRCEAGDDEMIGGVAPGYRCYARCTAGRA